ncbi:MAG: hypothetical protein H0T67_08055 [Burkholderiaceae bacterium]|nr:hypothetical protein [Burkholderiaceae bacterium]
MSALDQVPHSPTPWHLAKRVSLDHRAADSRWIKLPAGEWLGITNARGNSIAFTKRADDALIILAAPLIYDALLECSEAIRYPRGVTEGEWVALRAKVTHALMAVYP